MQWESGYKSRENPSQMSFRTISNKNMYKTFHLSTFSLFWEHKNFKWKVLHRGTKQTNSAFHELMPCHFLIKNVDHLVFLWSFSNNYENWEYRRTGKATKSFSRDLGLDPKWIISSKKNVSCKIFCVKVV